MIEVTGLTFAYDDGPPALRNVDLSVDAGETLALMGPNGAGKTTLLKCLAGLYDPDEGSVSVAGDAVGFAPEDPDDGLFAATVEEEVAFFPRNRDLDVESRVDAALRTMGVTDLRERMPQTLAAGEKRRVSLASVLAGDPAVVALDEPTSGIDTRHVEALGQVLEDLETTVVIGTHDAEFALRHADRVVIVKDGRIHRRGSAADLLGDPTTDFEAFGVRPPGAVTFARDRGWSEPSLTVETAAERVDIEEREGE